VGREARITMRGRDLTIRGDAHRNRRDNEPRAKGALPRPDGDVWVRVAAGLGNVDVIPQPNARNNDTTVVAGTETIARAVAFAGAVRNRYTAVVRIRDVHGRAARSDLELAWSYPAPSSGITPLRSENNGTTFAKD